MKAKHQKRLILSLIKDDLINTKLLQGLEDLGFNTDPYSLNISDTIFKLMKLEEHKDNDGLFEYYLELKSRVRHIEIIETSEALDLMAQEVYYILQNSKV